MKKWENFVSARDDILYTYIVTISGENTVDRLRSCVSSRDYSAGNNRDTPFRAGLINQIQAGRETFPRGISLRIRAYPWSVESAPPVRV